MLFSASFTSVNGTSEGTIRWQDIDTSDSTLKVAGAEVPLTESSGTVTFGLDGLTVIDFETGDAPPPEPPPYEFPEVPEWVLNIPTLNVDLFL